MRDFYFRRVQLVAFVFRRGDSVAAQSFVGGALRQGAMTFDDFGPHMNLNVPLFLV